MFRLISSENPMSRLISSESPMAMFFVLSITIAIEGRWENRRKKETVTVSRFLTGTKMGPLHSVGDVVDIRQLPSHSYIFPDTNFMLDWPGSLGQRYLFSVQFWWLYRVTWTTAKLFSQNTITAPNGYMVLVSYFKPIDIQWVMRSIQRRPRLLPKTFPDILLGWVDLGTKDI